MHMLDMIAVSQSMKSDITDCKTVHDGIRSNHSALCLLWALRSFKPKVNSMSKGKPNIRVIQYDDCLNESYNDHIRENYNLNDNIYDDFCNTIKLAAAAVASEPEQQDKPRFAYNKDV
jgi:hypothetical protein